jgi:hypothetical protein
MTVTILRQHTVTTVADRISDSQAYPSRRDDDPYGGRAKRDEHERSDRRASPPRRRSGRYVFVPLHTLVLPAAL